MPKKSSFTTKADETPEFQTFWNIWRVHARNTDGRGLARDTFQKQVRAGANPQDIIDGALCFFRTMKEKDREFVPLSSTWLNRGSFEDLALIHREYQARVSQKAQSDTPKREYVSEERRTELVNAARQAVRGMRAH